MDNTRVHTDVKYMGGWLVDGNVGEKTEQGPEEGGGAEAETQETGSVPGSGRSPGEEMTTHPRILAWRIPRTEEPGGTQSIFSQQVRHS